MQDNTKKLLKENYDFLKEQEDEKDSETLQELIVDGFDVEQIWQQIELQNRKLLDLSVINVSRLIAAKDSLWFEVPNDETQSLENDSSGSQGDNNEEDTDEKQNYDDSKGTELNLENPDSDSDENGSNNEDNGLEEESIQKTSKSKNIFRKSVVDDDFFKLDEMERFLKQEESGKKKKKLDDSEESDEEGSIDFFNSDLDEDSDDEDNLNPKYNDFFESNENDNQYKEENPQSDESGLESDDSALELSDLETKELSSNEQDRDKSNVKVASDSSDEESDNDADKIDLKSSLEVREERLKKKIEQIEDKALQEKSWQLKGEVTASSRPQNSLLAEVVQFDLTSRPGNIYYLYSQ